MIHVIRIADNDKHFSLAIQEYTKRLNNKITVHTIKPIKNTNVSYIKRDETEKICTKLAKLHGKVFICDEQGKGFTSTEFAQKLEQIQNIGDNIIFVIGGSYGINIETISAKYSIELFQFSKMVIPHSFAFLFLLEQIYRAHEIIKGSSYHHS